MMRGVVSRISAAEGLGMTQAANGLERDTRGRSEARRAVDLRLRPAGKQKRLSWTVPSGERRSPPPRAGVSVGDG